MDQKFSSFVVEGAIAAPATALKENGDIDTEKVDDYVDFLTRHEIDGVFILGTLGEGMSLTVDERKQVAEAWVRYGQGRLSTVIVHVGTNNIRDSIELAKHAEQIKASAIACVCPSYYKPADEETVVDYMEQVAAAAPNTPFYYYCINFVTGVFCKMFFLTVCLCVFIALVIVVVIDICIIIIIIVTVGGYV
ncbi:N-acetylneuraminate lyase [Plakobranchus ocellatus]|uniref:N-acetylneuraminate lyase n=1 Tax=Plakobranchus ocellatus TaxID=259542 RepID=A0AAV4CF07_9GAST|nr:N-acetylneuraminate lyase [Plakobranchus ocellatus]